MQSATDQPTMICTFSKGINNKFSLTAPDPRLLYPEVVANYIVAAQTIQFNFLKCH